MRTVLYTNNMEPITVIDISESGVRYLEQYGHFRMAILQPANLSYYTSYNHIVERFPDVTIRAEKFIYRGSPHMMLFTDDEENALLLKSSFLAGQTSHVNKLKREAYSEGFFRALRSIGA